MVPFDYQPRTRVVFGPGTPARLSAAARDLGFRRALIVARAGPVQAGLVDQATGLLEALKSRW
jgi:alcohol dehydrogenase